MYKISSKQNSLDVFSRSRAALMGAATLFILLAHCYIRFDVISPDKWMITKAWNIANELFVGSVDIFVFLSGMSMFFSMKKDPSVKNFYKKRALRILPAYFNVASLWYI